MTSSALSQPSSSPQAILISPNTGELEFKKCTFKSGATYEGTFKGTKRHGRGYWSHPEGEVYEGEYAENKQNGFGTYIFSLGKRYIGQWRNGEMSGEGVYMFTASSSTFYAGCYDQDKKHGSGYYRYENGLVTVQKWDHNLLVYESDATPSERVDCTKFILHITNEVRCVAPRELGAHPEILGPRAFQFLSGATYTGQYSGTKKWGVGQWHHPQGDSYSGQFEDNKHNGWGVYVSGRSGKKYVGQWVNGKMDGWGVYFFTLEETEFFIGEYKNDKKNGTGMYHFAESESNYAQMWEQGSLTKETEADRTIVAGYLEAVRNIILTVQVYAPQYMPLITL